MVSAEAQLLRQNAESPAADASLKLLESTIDASARELGASAGFKLKNPGLASDSLSFDPIDGYESQVTQSHHKNINALHTLEQRDSSAANHPPESQQGSAEIPPEDRLAEFLTQPVPPEGTLPFLEARSKAADIFSDQLGIVDGAINNYFNFSGMEAIIPLTQKEYNTAAGNLSEQSRSQLSSLPKLFFTGRTDQAEAILSELKSGASDKVKELLQTYFDALKQSAKENPDTLTQYTQAYETFKREWQTLDQMKEDYNASALGRSKPYKRSSLPE